jgi:hypothetical protein
MGMYTAIVLVERIYTDFSKCESVQYVKNLQYEETQDSYVFSHHRLWKKFNIG